MGGFLRFVTVLVTRAADDTVYIFYSETDESCSVVAVDSFSAELHIVLRADSESEALTLVGKDFVEKRRCVAVLGLLVSVQSAWILAATKTRAVTLPGERQAQVVVQSDWIEVPLKLTNDQLVQFELKNNLMEALTRYPIDELHFFSDEVDLTRPFGPPFAPTEEPRSQFAWNEMLRSSFRVAGLGEYCSTLLEGYCASSMRTSGEMHIAIICRRSMVSPDEFEIDHICWAVDRFASFTLQRRSQTAGPGGISRDAVAAHYEEFASEVRRGNGGPLAETGLCILWLDDEIDVLQGGASVKVASAMVKSCERRFGWSQAVRAHGSADGAAGEAWNVIVDQVRGLTTTTGWFEEDETAPRILKCQESRQNGLLVVGSRDGLEAVNEFLLFFTLVITAELVRQVCEDFEGPAWEGVDYSPSDLCESVLDVPLAKVAAAFAAGSADAVTFLLAHRESLFGDSVSAWLPPLLLSPLRQRVAYYIGSAGTAVQQSLETLQRFRASACLQRLNLACVENRILKSSASGSSFKLSVSLSRLATATHVVLSLPSSRSLTMSVWADNNVLLLDSLALPSILHPRYAPVIVRLPTHPWDAFRVGKDLPPRSRGHHSLLRFEFHCVHNDDEPLEIRQLVIVGTAGLLRDDVYAKTELWRLRCLRALHSQGKSSVISSVAEYVAGGGESGPAHLVNTNLSQLKVVSMSPTASVDYLDAARHVESSSLHDLLALEQKRLQLGLSVAERDRLLVNAGLQTESLNPYRLLGARDATLEEMRRSSVPASFLNCSSGDGCRGLGALTLSISRNKLCCRCLGRFCVKCMEESILLETRSSSSSPVCFVCHGQVEEERALFREIQQAAKFAAEPQSSLEAVSLRHLLVLCGSLRVPGCYPFVRAGAEVSDARLQLLFMPLDAVPLSLFWTAPVRGPAQFDVHLPGLSVVRGVSFVAPSVGWAASDIRAEARFEDGSLCFEGRLDDAAASPVWNLECSSRDAHSVLHVTVSAVDGSCFRLARLIVSFSSLDFVATSSPLPALHPSEIFGKKGLQTSSSRQVATKLPRSMVQEELEASFPEMHLLEVARKEFIGSNVLELWLVRQRNSVHFPGGGVVIQVTRSEGLLEQTLKQVRISCLQVDERGDLVDVEPLSALVIPSIPPGHAQSLLFFPLEPRSHVSCFRFEFFNDQSRPRAILVVNNSPK